MKTVILGGYGQLGTALEKFSPETVVALSRKNADLTNIDQLFAKLESLSPDVLINCAAYNHVDRAEAEPDLAFALNAVAPGQLAEWCDARGIIFVHFSTDYVFGGDLDRDVPYREVDAPLPVSRYGESKLAGERNVLAACAQSFVIRTCGLYGPSRSPGKGNFIKTMLKLAESRDELNIVDDQRCTPTFTDDLAEVTLKLISTSAFGLYHATNSGSVTWCELAKEVFRLRNLSTVVHPITSEQFGSAARRPAYSVLDCSKLSETIQVSLPNWQSAVERYLNLAESE
ncbi:dTDP-4-dehydrorhamnose reductase [Planctomycetaceae bacterium]|nr:dTDP-4-dehydrorhamnose reductase [Planctomycetaceae bacterium]